MIKHLLINVSLMEREPYLSESEKDPESQEINLKNLRSNACLIKSFHLFRKLIQEKRSNQKPKVE